MLPQKGIYIIENLNLEELARDRRFAFAFVGILLPFSRSHESEADHIGLLLMAAAGYDPNEAAVFWQRMEKSARGGTPEFLSTHPSHQRRERDLRAWVNEALPLYRASTRQKGDTPLPRLGRGEL